MNICKKIILIPFGFLFGWTLVANAAVDAKQSLADPKPTFSNVVMPIVPPTTKPTRLLFIGNSFSFYNNGIHNHLGGLIRSSGDWKIKKNKLRLSTLSGGHIYQHSADLTYLINSPSDNWQAVVLQGHSNESIHPKKMSRFIGSTTHAVQQILAKGMQPILFMTWGYKGQPKMSENIANAYTKLANKLKILVVPVGLAFAQAEEQLGNIELFVPDVLGIDDTQSLTYRKDWKHPSAAGTYLAASVFYSVLYQRSPEGLIYHATLDKETALALQKLSWQVTQSFYSQIL